MQAVHNIVAMAYFYIYLILISPVKVRLPNSHIPSQSWKKSVGQIFIPY